MRVYRSPSRIAGFGLVLAVYFVFALAWQAGSPARAQADDPNPPAETVKLIFIHHSSGENWLTDGNGNLGMALGENNYFVSDTNYGWGPDSIGDITDIINWPEWFLSPESPRYMQAVYQESGQHSNYTRTLSDPGGENQIILFKSCFPNSNLAGNPDDPPEEGLDFTVGNAKYIYNSLLSYFSTRPDKLFIVITAPPVQDPTYADNARAFNTWLVQDWLSENNYPLNNVAVWDFYNVLTHEDNHHRFNNGTIEYITSNGDNTSFYPSSGDDDHPNEAGNRKASEEFLPMLNIFYNRWKSAAPAQPPLRETPAGAVELQPVEPAPAVTSDVIDDFEAGNPEGSQGWQANWDETFEQNSITCVPEASMAQSGASALHINYSIEPNSWELCSLIYDNARDWSTANGISFYIHASEPALPLDIMVYGGTIEALESYITSIETSQEMADGWIYVEYIWDRLRRASWEENAGTPFNPANAMGLAIGIVAYPDQTNQGEIWIDEVRLVGAAEAQPPAVEPTVISAAPEVAATEVEGQEPTQETSTGREEETKERGGGLCPLPLALGIAAGYFGLRFRKSRK